MPIMAGIGAAASIAGSAISSGSKKTTQTPLLSPELQTAQDTSLGDLEGILKNPSAGLAPILGGAQDSINTSYKNLPNIATSMLAARGFGSSGAVGTSTYDTEGARLGSLSSLYAQMAQLASSRQLSANQIIAQMIASGKGETTTTPSNSLGAGLVSGGNSLSGLSAIATLAQMLNTGGGASPFGTGGILGTGQTPAGTPSTIDYSLPSSGDFSSSPVSSITPNYSGPTYSTDPTGAGINP